MATKLFEPFSRAYKNITIQKQFKQTSSCPGNEINHKPKLHACVIESGITIAYLEDSAKSTFADNLNKFKRIKWILEGIRVTPFTTWTNCLDIALLSGLTFAKSAHLCTMNFFVS